MTSEAGGGWKSRRKAEPKKVKAAEIVLPGKAKITKAGDVPLELLADALCHEPKNHWLESLKGLPYSEEACLKAMKDPKFGDLVWEASVKNIIAPAIPALVRTMVNESRQGSDKYMGLLLKMMGKLGPDAQNTVNIEFRSMSEEQLREEAKNLMESISEQIKPGDA